MNHGSGVSSTRDRLSELAGAAGYHHLRRQADLPYFASLAEFERDLIRERTNAGLAAARTRGRKGGRPKGVDEKKRKAALALKRDPQYTIREICEIV